MKPGSRGCLSHCMFDVCSKQSYRKKSRTNVRWMAASKPNDLREEAVQGAPCIMQTHSHAASSWLVSMLARVLQSLAETLGLCDRLARQDTFFVCCVGKGKGIACMRGCCARSSLGNGFSQLPPEHHFGCGGLGSFHVDMTMLAAASTCMSTHKSLQHICQHTCHASFFVSTSMAADVKWMLRHYAFPGTCIAWYVFNYILLVICLSHSVAVKKCTNHFNPLPALLPMHIPIGMSLACKHHALLHAPYSAHP